LNLKVEGEEIFSVPFEDPGRRERVFAR